MKKYFGLLICLLSVGIRPALAQQEDENPPPAHYQPAPPSQPKPSLKQAAPQPQAQTNQEILNRVADYLTNLTTIIADFTQIAPDASLASGQFYLKRPYHMRWQYNPPTPVLMLTRGNYLTFYDFELDQVSDIPIEDTLIGFLAKKNISFNTEVKVTDLKVTPGAIRISMIQDSKPKDGSLTLEFTDNPLQLRNFVVTDASGQVTTVSLQNARFGVSIDDKFFEFDDPRKHSPRDRRQKVK